MLSTWIHMHCLLSISKTSIRFDFNFWIPFGLCDIVLCWGGGSWSSSEAIGLSIWICWFVFWLFWNNNNVCSINTQEYYSWRNTKDMAIVYVCTVSVYVTPCTPGVVPSPVLGVDWLALRYSVAVTTAEGPPLTRGEYRVLQWRPTSRMAIKRFLNCDITGTFIYNTLNWVIINNWIGLGSNESTVNTNLRIFLVYFLSTRIIFLKLKLL